MRDSEQEIGCVVHMREKSPSLEKTKADLKAEPGPIGKTVRDLLKDNELCRKHGNKSPCTECNPTPETT